MNLNEIVRLELEPFADRAIVEGADVVLGPQQAQNFSLALHELATNAAKYGALSNGTEMVEVFWALVDSGKNTRLKFKWQEQGGPPVVAPTRRGFGTSLQRGRVPARDFGAPISFNRPARSFFGLPSVSVRSTAGSKRALPALQARPRAPSFARFDCSDPSLHFFRPSPNRS